MQVTEYIVKFLKSKGISCVFELSGGMIMQLIDSIHLDGTIKLVTVHHEQTSSFAADAVGRITGLPGVAIATSGPGATNLLTGIGSCFFDSSPALFLTGQVNQSEQKKDKNIRQLGFQETDIVSMVKPITKFAYQITDAGQVPYYLEKAFNISISGRPGPVLLDIPMDIFRANLDETIYAERQTAEAKNKGLDERLVNNLVAGLKQAQRPVILAGGGINASRTAPLLRQIVEKLSIPVVYSLLGVDILPSNHKLRVGMIGTYGNRWANISLYNSDFVLVLGSRLDIRQTGADTISFKKNKIIYHVDCEPEEINNRVVGCEVLTADLKDFMPFFNEKIKGDFFEPKEQWLKQIEYLKDQWPDVNELQNIKGINPNVFMHALSKAKIDFTAYVADVGQHQMWAAQSIEIKQGQRFLTSGGMGAMGFSLPAAIGVCMSTSLKPVCVIAGDAGFQLNIQELQTIVRNNLPIKIVIINNNCHGMTRQFQETYFKERYQSTIWGYSAPNFAKVAQAYGIDAETISTESEINSGLLKMEASSKPFLLQVMIDSYVNVYPKLAFGLPMSEMEPFAKPMEMEST